MKRAIIIGLAVLAGYTWVVHTIGFRHCATALEVVMISKLHLEERERTLLLHDVQAVKWPVVWRDLRGIWCAREARAEDTCPPGYEPARQPGPQGWPRHGCYPIGFDYDAANADIMESQARGIRKIDPADMRAIPEGMEAFAMGHIPDMKCSWLFHVEPFATAEQWSRENPGWRPYGNPIADTRNWKAGDLNIWIVFKRQECR